MMNFKSILLVGLVAALLQIVAVRTARGAEWQFSVGNPNGKGRTFLWVPPTCRQVRGLILAQQVILEKPALEDPAIRRAAADENLAIVLVVPGCIGDYDDKGKGAETLQKILDDLAEVSGYAEISRSPLLTFGHSGGAIFAWNTAYWNPGRCIGVVGLKSAPIHPPAYAPKSNVDGVPDPRRQRAIRIVGRQKPSGGLALALGPRHPAGVSRDWRGVADERTGRAWGDALRLGRRAGPVRGPVHPRSRRALPHPRGSSSAAGQTGGAQPRRRWNRAGSRTRPS